MFCITQTCYKFSNAAPDSLLDITSDSTSVQPSFRSSFIYTTVVSVTLFVFRIKSPTTGLVSAEKGIALHECMTNVIRRRYKSWKKRQGESAPYPRPAMPHLNPGCFGMQLLRPAKPSDGPWAAIVIRIALYECKTNLILRHPYNWKVIPAESFTEPPAGYFRIPVFRLPERLPYISNTVVFRDARSCEIAAFSMSYVCIAGILEG